MNNVRRQKLREAIRMLDHALSMVEQVCDKEEDCMDNIPENLQYSERYEKMEDAVDALNDAMEKIDEAKEQIQAII